MFLTRIFPIFLVAILLSGCAFFRDRIGDYKTTNLDLTTMQYTKIGNHTIDSMLPIKDARDFKAGKYQIPLPPIGTQ